jgi:hypothetical protein
VAGYLIKMQLHCFRVGPRRGDGGAFAMHAGQIAPNR